jgi:ABC-type multidrug transport system fused ATPase/permease subunit
LTEVNDQQEYSLREILKLAWRCWPYYRPQLKHLLTFIGLNVLVGLIIIAVYFVGFDLIENKVLLGERLQPLQASVLFLGEEYVTTGDENEAQLTDEQRQRVRNGVLIVGVITWLLITTYSAAARYYEAWIFQRINQYLRIEMLNRVERLSLRYHSHSRTGDAMYRVYQDSATITNILQWLILTPSRAIAVLVSGLVLLLFFSPWFGLLMIAAGIPIAYLMRYLIPKVRDSARAARELNSDLTSRIQESLAAIRVIKSNAAEERMMGTFERESQLALDAAYQMRLNMTLLMLGVLLTAFIAFLVAEYFMATWALAEKATFLGGTVALVGFAVWNLGAYRSAAEKGNEATSTIWEIAFLWSVVQDLTVGLKRAFFLLDLEPEVTEPENPEVYPATPDAVRFEEVRFSYEPGKEVLSGVNLQAQKGTVTAIVGGTGSGKSTLMSLLLRLYDPDAGRVMINDTDLRDIGIDDIRSNTAIALQQNVLFAMSVVDNIRYGRDDVPDAAVIDAAKIACADGFIKDMPNGYATELGERGGKLSTGQRQRLSIARAVLRDTPVLILDEPTASLDAETEQRVIRNLAEWGHDRVVFIITHRLSTIRNADQIAFLEDGKIKELGTHEALIERQGAYNRFVLAESGDDSTGVNHG